MKPLSSRRLFILAFVVLIATNIAVLAGVAANRTGEPEALVLLTERELRLPPGLRYHEEDSGMALRLVWRTLGAQEESNIYPRWQSPAWFDSEKLAELGFSVNELAGAERPEAFRKRPLPREVYIVLEYNGKTYKEALRRAEKALVERKEQAEANGEDKKLRAELEQAEIRLRRERLTESRLFAVDAGLYPEKLRDTYDDRSRFIITQGQVRPTYPNMRQNNKATGYITKLSIENIHVPLEHQQVFEGVTGRDESKGKPFERPGYWVELAYGKRLEPWIVAVRQRPNQTD